MPVEWKEDARVKEAQQNLRKIRAQSLKYLMCKYEVPSSILRAHVKPPDVVGCT